MKPTFQCVEAAHRQDRETRPRKGSGFPKTDYGFQAYAADFGRGNGRSGPSFRGISRDYFRGEARSYFVAEATLFGLLVLTAAVPVIESVKGLAHFVYRVL